MKKRTLGRTDLQVSELGLGLEYLNGQPPEVVTAVLETALENGVNYFDVIFSFPEYLDNLAPALGPARDDIYVTAHLGSGEKDGQYHKTRAVSRSKAYFEDVLARLGTDHVDVLFLHNCDSDADYDRLFKPNGIYDLARRLQDEGKARYLGFSGHTPSVARRAVESGHVDVLMFPVNLTVRATELRPLLKACVTAQVGVVAMKPYAGGKLLNETRTVRVAKSQGGGEARKVHKTVEITPVHCLSYVLGQVGVTSVVPGCSTVAEMNAAFDYLTASDEAKDFAAALSSLDYDEQGECVYCNHCLPCPSGIDVGQVMRLLDTAVAQGMTEAVRTSYNGFSAQASDCMACGVCEERCPFDVPVVARMEQAVAQFGG